MTGKPVDDEVFFVEKKPFPTFDEASSIMRTGITPLDTEEASLFNLRGRVIAEDIVSDSNIPMLDNSAMDGYAVQAADTSGAAPGTPAVLTVTGEIQAGSDPEGYHLGSGEAIRIMTGAPIPAGADTVVEFEKTSEENNRVEVFHSFSPGDNVRRAGEDISTGDMVLETGTMLLPAHVGLLASIGRESALVYRRPRVAIITTGNEIAEPGQPLKRGWVRNSNAYTLHGLVEEYGGIPHYLGIAEDTPEKTREILQKALTYDLVITTGGVSMGRYDFVPDVMKDLGIDVRVEKVLMKPGKPCVFGLRGPVPVFGLPGNPVSTMVSFLQFVRPALLSLMGSRKIDKPVLRAISRKLIKKKPDRTHFIRGYFDIEDGQVYVSTTGPQGSGILRSMGMANCLIIVPMGVSAVEEGAPVDIQLIHHGEV